MSNKKPTKTPAKTSTKMPAMKLPIAELLPVRKMIKAKNAAIENRKIAEIAELLWLSESLDEDEIHARVVRALELYESLEPVGGAEGMLAAQMVGTHSAALECLRRAALPSQSFEGRDMALKHAQKLMTLYAQQLAALNKHRGKGQQKVTVEHVNVEAGGQAIVGHVEAGTTRAQKRSGAAAVEPGKTGDLDMKPGVAPEPKDEG